MENGKLQEKRGETKNKSAYETKFKVQKAMRGKNALKITANALLATNGRQTKGLSKAICLGVAATDTP